MSILMVAAEAREFKGLLPYCRHVRPLAARVHWAREADLGGRSLTLVANGAGAERAAAAAGVLGRPEAIVSTGFCGALDSSLAIGDVFTACEVEGLGRRFRACVPAGTRASGRLITLDHVAQTAGEKAALRASGAAAVDMEAAGPARVAENLAVPFFCVRSVTDLADESLHNDFNGALRGDGHFDTIHLLRVAASSPAAMLPELIRLGRRVRVAARSLGEFLADCRF